MHFLKFLSFIHVCFALSFEKDIKDKGRNVMKPYGRSLAKCLKEVRKWHMYL